MMELCQLTALNKSIQFRLAALVKELEHKADARNGEDSDD